MIISIKIFSHILSSIILHQVQCSRVFSEPFIFNPNETKFFNRQEQFQSYSSWNSKAITKQEAIANVTNVILENMGAFQVPGVVVGFSCKNKTIWTAAFGLKDIENNVKAKVADVWSLASISKPLTSTLIAYLVQTGILDLDVPINKYLSKDVFPQKTYEGKAVNITLRQCLSHTAGLRMSYIPEDLFLNVFKAVNVTQSVVQFNGDPLLSKPGTEYSYSNYGFQVVGAIIEAVLKDTFPNIIRKFYQKLGMMSTFAESQALFKNRPRYYELNTEGQLEQDDVVDRLVWYEGWWPSGGMVSTVKDLLIFGNLWLSSYYGENDSNFI